MLGMSKEPGGEGEARRAEQGNIFLFLASLTEPLTFKPAKNEVPSLSPLLPTPPNYSGSAFGRA